MAVGDATPVDPLRGARILTTRAKEDEGPLEALLMARGAQPIPLPCIEFEPPSDPGPLEAAVARLSRGERPHLLVLASAHAAERFFGFLRLHGLDPAVALSGVRIAAVGPGTTRALVRLGAAPALVPEQGVGAEALAAALAPTVAGKEALLPRAEEGNPELPARLERAGARVTAVALYRTVPARAADPDAAAELRAGRIAAIAFASGSAARGFAAVFGPEAEALARRSRVVCMGAACAAAARETGLPVHAVSEGGFPELVETLARALAAP